MTFLYFVVDICFYNYTSFKTDIILHALLEKKKNKFLFFLSLLFIDFLLQTYGRFFLLYTILYFINKRIKCSLETLLGVFSRFLLLYLLYKIGVFLLFWKFVFEPFGFFINLLLLGIMHKKK